MSEEIFLFIFGLFCVFSMSGEKSSQAHFSIAVIVPKKHTNNNINIIHYLSLIHAISAAVKKQMLAYMQNINEKDMYPKEQHEQIF